MKLKKWLLLTHLIVMVAPIIASLVLYGIITDYNKKTELMDYLVAMSKFKSYEDKLNNFDLYGGKYNFKENFIKVEDANLVKIELYNSLGQGLYSSDGNVIYVNTTEQTYSNLYNIESGYKAYSLKKPVFKENTLVGFYKITIARNGFVEAINNRTIIMIGILLLIIIMIFLVVMILLNLKLNRPIKFLIEGMNNFAKGEGEIVKYQYKDEIGELINHFNAMKNDIEEKRKTIELQQKSKEYMISAISHDLKTPLTAIRAYAEAITNENNFDMNSVKDKALVILSKSDYMKNMIDDLMTYNILITEQKLEFVEVEGDELFEMLFSGFDESCEKNKIYLHTDIAVSGKYVVDVMQLTRVVDNLMSNALRYTAVDGHIWMGAYSLDKKLPNWLSGEVSEDLMLWKRDGCLIFIKNQGEVIPKNEIRDIFNPFYQRDDSRNKKSKSGVGLGLSIVNLVIEKHQGEIKVFSEDNYTIFTCWIPKKKF